MSNIDDDTAECNCSERLRVNNINIVNGEINNNNISIDTTARTNNNTVIIICDTKKNKSYCEKAVQTVFEFEISADKTQNMDKDSNDLNNFPVGNNVNNSSKFKNVPTDDDDIVAIDECQTMYSEFNTRSNNESNIAEGTSRAQDMSVSDARYVDKSMPVNNPMTVSSQITKLVNDQSDRNKALINNIFLNYMSAANEILPSHKFALKQIIDSIRKELPSADMTQEKNVHAFTQTEDKQNEDKKTQTDLEYPNAYYNNCTINMELNCVAMKEFLRESKIYFEEFQNKIQYLFKQYTIQSKNNNDKLQNQNSFYLEGANASSSGTSDKVNFAVLNNDIAGIDINVSNRGMAADTQNLANNINNSRHKGSIGNGSYSNKKQNNTAAVDANNNNKAYNTLNSIPRRQLVLQGEQAPVIQPGFSGNHSVQTRAGRPRNEITNQRFSPYSRQQFWQQEFNNRHRQPQQVPEWPNTNGMQVQHSSIIRQFSGFQTPNPPNNQSLFTSHQPHQHHF